MAELGRGEGRLKKSSYSTHMVGKGVQGLEMLQAGEQVTYGCVDRGRKQSKPRKVKCKRRDP